MTFLLKGHFKLLPVTEMTSVTFKVTDQLTTAFSITSVLQYIYTAYLLILVFSLAFCKPHCTNNSVNCQLIHTEFSS